MLQSLFQPYKPSSRTNVNIKREDTNPKPTITPPPSIVLAEPYEKTTSFNQSQHQEWVKIHDILRMCLKTKKERRWSPSESYFMNDIVIFQDKWYICGVSETGLSVNSPLHNTIVWQPFSNEQKKHDIHRNQLLYAGEWKSNTGYRQYELVEHKSLWYICHVPLSTIGDVMIPSEWKMISGLSEPEQKIDNDNDEIQRLQEEINTLKNTIHQQKLDSHPVSQTPQQHRGLGEVSETKRSPNWSISRWTHNLLKSTTFEPDNYKVQVDFSTIEQQNDVFVELIVSLKTHAVTSKKGKDTKDYSRIQCFLTNKRCHMLIIVDYEIIMELERENVTNFELSTFEHLKIDFSLDQVCCKPFVQHESPPLTELKEIYCLMRWE